MASDMRSRSVKPTRRVVPLRNTTARMGNSMRQRAPISRFVKPAARTIVRGDTSFLENRLPTGFVRFMPGLPECA
jgi:hypothetical protein